MVAEAEEIELLNYYLSLVISPVFEDAIPFTTACTEDMDPLAWWEKIARIPSGECDVLAILAIKIFSILVNSMPDESLGQTQR